MNNKKAMQPKMQLKTEIKTTTTKYVIVYIQCAKYTTAENHCQG